MVLPKQALEKHLVYLHINNHDYLAYLIPLLECLYKERWSKEAGLGGLVISPTRELALQVHLFMTIL